MSDDQERDPAAPKADDEEESAPASTPFDNPFFLPAILWALALYFGYDIVTNAEAYQEWPRFNQGGFAILSVAAIYYSWSAIKEKRAESERRID